MPRIITIAIEYGSGGRLIAQRVAEKLGIFYYDNEIIDLAARELGFDVDTIRRVSEEKSSSFMYTLSSTAFTLPLNDQVFAMQSKIIRHIAEFDTWQDNYLDHPEIPQIPHPRHVILFSPRGLLRQILQFHLFLKNF